MKDNISKANYISAAYNILSREGIGAVTIRRLAEALDCNSANLYRYFAGLDELISYASLKYLKDYLNEVRELPGQNFDTLTLHFAVWECFARYTFSSPELFNNLFWGKFSHQLDHIMQEYYALFPDELQGIDPYMHTVFLNGDFDYRDYLMLARCVEDGLFSQEDAKFLNTVSMHLYKGFFKDLLDHPNERDPQRSKEAFLACIKRVIRLQMSHPFVHNSDSI